MDTYDPTEIVAQVKAFEEDKSLLHDRMSRDYKLWRGDKWVPPPILQGFHTRTSSEPRSYGNKIVSFLTQAKVIPRIPIVRQWKELRKLAADKERFGIGALILANDRLEAIKEQPLQSWLAWSTALRGFSVGRAMLAKRANDETYVNVQPWDPRYVSWQVDEEGLQWAVHHIKRRRNYVTARYDTVLPGNRAYVDVYDCYNRTHNMVVGPNGAILKPPAPHGGQKVPVYLSVVGPQPLIFEDDDSGKAWESYGESIYNGARDYYDDINFITSVWMVIVARSAQQGLKIFSEDGTKTLKGNPFLDGAEIPLKSGNKEDVVPLGLLELARETPALFGLISAEGQRVTLPATAYGQLSLAISGYAINQLSSGILSVLQGCILAMESSYKQILDLLSEQYASGYFAEMPVAGYARNKAYFSEVAPIDTVRLGGKWEVRIRPNLPKDEPGKLQMAQQARQGPGGVPIFSDATVLEDIMEVEDADLEQEKVLEQVGKRAVPMVASYELMKAAEERGEIMQAQIILGEMELQMLQKQIEIAKMRMMAGAAGAMASGLPDLSGKNGGNGNGGGPGFSESTLPRPAQGLPPVEPQPQAGPLVEPGRPRPGAQDGQNPSPPEQMGM